MKYDYNGIFESAALEAYKNQMEHPYKRENLLYWMDAINNHDEFGEGFALGVTVAMEGMLHMLKTVYERSNDDKGVRV